MGDALFHYGVNMASKLVPAHLLSTLVMSNVEVHIHRASHSPKDSATGIPSPVSFAIHHSTHCKADVLFSLCAFVLLS